MRITKYDVRLCRLLDTTNFECPLCGEIKVFKPESGCGGGIEGFDHTWFRRRFFIMNLYKYTQTKYTCHSCGAKWKSDIIKVKIKEKGR